MKQATVVIGSNWGDEGKGLVTDYHAFHQGPSTIVCRFNGGAQAGHTVVTPEGQRHVFSHFGSGTLADRATYLSKFFIVNPILWRTERADLASKFVHPTLIVDPRCPVTTPIDMILNQAKEEMRGVSRHGSCGVGIGETIERSPKVPLSAGDTGSEKSLRRALDDIRKIYLPIRLNDLGLILSEEKRDLIHSNSLDNDFIDACQEMHASVRFYDESILSGSEPVVFEGAQGLLLDEDHDFFPHVTRSKTGLANVRLLAKAAGIGHLDVSYVTRAYMTRHGAGPFPSEDTAIAFEDHTNAPNQWQGSLRFGALDVDLIAATLQRDIACADGLSVHASMAVTCLDQVRNGAPIRVERCTMTVSPADVLKHLSRMTGLSTSLISFGPNRQFIMHQKADGSFYQ